MAKVESICAQCGAPFLTQQCWIARGEGRYCSRECGLAYRRANPKPRAVYAPLTQARLRELLHYDPETGLFTWLVRPVKASAVKVGDLAGGTPDNGYLRVKIERAQYHAHRLAFLYMTGEWPTAEVDHIDGVRDNNRWANLRDVARHMNLQNRKRANRTNTTGFMGVSRYPSGKYMSQIRARGEVHYLGSFDTPEAAHAAYVAAKRRLHEGHVE